jgi:hypothetical protein
MAGALRVEGILPQQSPGCQVFVGGSPPVEKPYPATAKSGRAVFLENAFWKNASVGLGIGGSRVVYWNYAAMRVYSSAFWKNLGVP